MQEYKLVTNTHKFRILTLVEGEWENIHKNSLINGRTIPEFKDRASAEAEIFKLEQAAAAQAEKERIENLPWSDVV